MSVPDFWSYAVPFTPIKRAADMMGTLMIGLIQLLARSHEQDNLFALNQDQMADPHAVQQAAKRELCLSVVDQVASLLSVSVPTQWDRIERETHQLITTAKRVQHDWILGLQARQIGPVGGKVERADQVIQPVLVLLNQVYQLSVNWLQRHAPHPDGKRWVPGEFKLAMTDGSWAGWGVGFHPFGQHR